VKIIRHIDSFEVISDDGTLSRKYYFDDNGRPQGDIRQGHEEARFPSSLSD